MKPIFADSFFFLAILNPDDQHHERATQFARSNARAFITTAWVLTEVGDALSGMGNREIFIEFIQQLHRNATVKVVPPSQALFDGGLVLFSQRVDKEWSLTDCISFCVMQQQKLEEALTGDRHFEQAGYLALLK
jgi:uncharacterized protein